MFEPGSPAQPDDALVDLLIKQAAEGLSPAEQRALDVLDSAVTQEYRRDIERAAAAISLAGSAPLPAPPQALRERLEREAEAFLVAANSWPAGSAAPTVMHLRPSQSIAAATATSAATATTATTAATATKPTKATTNPAVAATPATSAAAAAAPGLPLAPLAPRGFSGTAGWFAAAACLLLALFAWFRTPPPGAAPLAEVPVKVSAPPPLAPPPPAAERAALLAKTESLKVTLGPTKDPGAAGLRAADVVWDPATQQGFIRFVGLSANDPRVHQYQIWIFDGARDARYPVDGGVFDVPADAAEVVIPIHAALPVGKPAAFAVTLERPGGAVVSARDHVLALGATG
jgi:hypothetical protein